MQTKTLYTADGEKHLVSQEWAAECQKKGATIVSSSWTTDSGTLTGAAASGTTATVLVDDASCGRLTNTVTLSNGEVLVATRLVSLN